MPKVNVTLTATTQVSTNDDKTMEAVKGVADSGIMTVLHGLTPNCDSCGWRGDSIVSDDNESKASILEKVNASRGLTCPQCGSVVITDKDCDSIIQLLELIK